MYIMLLTAMLSQTSVRYQAKTFDAADLGPEEQNLSADEQACVASFLPAVWPAESAADFLAVKYARNDEDRSQACVTYWAERSEPTSDYVQRTEPMDSVRFSLDGSTAYWPERLQTMCLPAGALTGARNCLSNFALAPGQITEFLADKGGPSGNIELRFLWETVVSTPADYGRDRNQGRARSHTIED